MNYAVIFPGQGAQAVSMMAGFADCKIVRETFNTAHEVLGIDFWQLQEKGSAEELAKTTITQPLLLTAGVAVYRLWREMGAPEPTLAAGHSLGEYCALVAAQALDFNTALLVVNKRAQLMEESAKNSVGAMAAVIGATPEIINTTCAEICEQFINKNMTVEAVNYNSPEQVVIAGDKDAVIACCEALKAKGVKRALMLNVGGAFHSRLMQGASEAMVEVLKSAEINPPKFSVIHNATLESHNSPDKIREVLAKQVAAPVRWTDTVLTIAKSGINVTVESAPSKVLAGLSKRINPNITCYSLTDKTVCESVIKETFTT